MKNPLALVLGALALAGCATAQPTPGLEPVAAAPDCAALAAEVGAAEQAQRAARDKQGSAWKAVVPFAVAGQYASAKSAERKAQERITQLRMDADRLGCPAVDGAAS